MRWALVLLLLAELAVAHGHGYRSPPTFRERFLHCNCSSVTCTVCTPAEDRVDPEPRVRYTKRVEVTERWGDFGRIVVRYRFLTTVHSAEQTACVT